jgi:hypothetical protein
MKTSMFLLLLSLSACVGQAITNQELCKTEACDYCRSLLDTKAPLTLQPVLTTLPPDPKTLLSCEVQFPNGSLGWCCPSNN